MDLIYCIAALIAIMIIVYIDVQKNIHVGSIGEQIVGNILEHLPADYVVLNDVKYNKCQIDHLVINHTKKLIFVIETKMWKGDVIGDKKDDKWSCDSGIYRNPVKQNAYHCSVVQRKFKGYNVLNVVVFVKTRTFPRYKNVISEKELYEYITGYKMNV